MMKETFLVKHAVGGRTFVDSGRTAVAHAIAEENGRWRIDADVPYGPDIDELLKWKRELNVFLFEEAEGEPVVKNWYYVKDGPVTYDKESGRLTIVADSRIRYVPDRFGTA